MAREPIEQKEYQQLLQNLKLTVEGLLIRQVSNVWSIYGGLNRLHHAMEKIFKHGCRVFTPQGDPDCWVFIQGLSWLGPSLAKNSPTFLNDFEETLPQLPPSMNSKAMIWLYKSLENHSLSQKLSWLLSDQEHLHSCFETNAYLCQEIYGEATLYCLKAVERNQASLLAEIDPSLYLAEWNYKVSHKAHRRCSSFPQAEFKEWPKFPKQYSDEVQRMSSPDPCLSNETSSIKDSDEQSSSPIKSTYLKHYFLSKSLPNFLDDRTINEPKLTNKFSLSIPLASSNLNYESSIVLEDLKSPILLTKNMSKLVTENDGIVNSKLEREKPRQNSEESARADLINNNNTSSVDHPNGNAIPKKIKDKASTSIRPSALRLTPNTKRTIIAGSVPERGSNDWGRRHKKSFIEDGGSSVSPMATGFFPKPTQGQSITSFLSSGQFSRTSAELDRENAHFSISEAMIAAIEQVKCNRELRLAEEIGEVCEESDEEINNLKQRIRLRRCQKLAERERTLWGINLLSDGKTDTTTTDQSASPPSSSTGTPSESISTEGVDDLEVDEVKNLSQLKNSGLSVSMASLYSEADLSKNHSTILSTRPTVSNSSLEMVSGDSFLSAEGVALSLISRFSEKQLPSASDLEWLVSEQDAPQQLLPLPLSWPVSPDEAEDADKRQATLLRGTFEWAPPRPQLIFTPHTTPVRRVAMAKQNYRCAGCGMKVAPKYAHRFRYCEYLGRYFCTGCHSNQLAYIPGRILTKWDFTRCPVSSFSYRLLEQMAADPLFQIGDLNPSLYRKARNLDRTRQLRLQLFYLKDFLLFCRFAERLHEALNKEPIYLFSEVEVYSINDLLQVKNGEIIVRLKELISSGIEHVTFCELCQARGFVCELCSSKEVIYPWQLSRVTRCDPCGSCFHLHCYKTMESSFENSLKLSPSPSSESTTSCPRCTRITARRRSRESSKDQIVEETN